MLENRQRFTWGLDAHKTYEDTTGYIVLLTELWQIWRFLLLMYCAVMSYTSGGYLAFVFQDKVRRSIDGSGSNC